RPLTRCFTPPPWTQRTPSLRFSRGRKTILCPLCPCWCREPASQLSVATEALMGEKDHSDRKLAGGGRLTYVPLASIQAVRAATSDPIARAQLLADVCRLNTLYMVMNAGSGHIGSSFSSTDLITWLWTEELTDANSGAPNADTYFSSKGHDAPALYALLIALG